MSDSFAGLGAAIASEAILIPEPIRLIIGPIIQTRIQQIVKTTEGRRQQKMVLLFLGTATGLKGYICIKGKRSNL